MTTYRLLRPIDVLHLRGNRLFADAGHGEAVMPPWPSVIAGALRARIVADREPDPGEFRRGNASDPDVVRVVGAGPSALGSFRITMTALAGPAKSGEITTFFPAPADLVIQGTESAPRPGRLVPQDLAAHALRGSFSLPKAAVLRSGERSKALGGIWVTIEGLQAHLAGDTVDVRHLVSVASLWKREDRLGIAIDHDLRTAATGMLYTTEAVALAPGVGILAGVEGADDVLPELGLVRLGGDGRGAELVAWPSPAPAAPPFRTPRTPRFRMLLATPGIFPEGWLPPFDRSDDGPFLAHRGLKARLVCATVPRHEVVSGWDVARQRPKAAVRTAPAGSVYWFERVQGDLAVLADLHEHGLWALCGDLDEEQRARRAEGFNNVWFGDWLD